MKRNLTGLFLTGCIILAMACQSAALHHKGVSGCTPPVPRANGFTTPIHLAAMNGDQAKLECLLGKNPDGLNVPDQLGRTPLHWAVANGHLGTAERLIELGADVNARDQTGWTPLCLAAFGGHQQTAGMLLDHGAILNDPTQEPPLCLAAARGHQQLVGFLLERGAQRTARDRYNKSALDYALENGHDETAQCLRQAAGK